MNSLKISLAIVLGILLLVVGAIYLTHSAQNLPSFFPGYDLNSSRIHYKHAIASILLGIASFIFAWFQSGKKASGGNIQTQ